MLDQYPEFFHYLGEKRFEVQERLGTDGPELAKVLRQYPDIVRPKVGVADQYSQYIKAFCQFGVSKPRLAKFFEEYFNPEVHWWELGTGQHNTNVELIQQDLSKSQIDLIKSGRTDAIQLAQYLEGAVGSVGTARSYDNLSFSRRTPGVGARHLPNLIESVLYRKSGDDMDTSEALVDGVASSPPTVRRIRKTGPSSKTKSPVGEPMEAGEVPDREFIVTAHEPAPSGVAIGTDPPVHPLIPNQIYVLRMGVSRARASNLAGGQVSVGDIPPSGLKTHWVVTSRDVIFMPEQTGCRVRQIGELWEASFDLFVPEKGDSKFHQLQIKTGTKLGELKVSIFAVHNAKERELYRELSVELSGKEMISKDETIVAPAHTLLRTTHEWTTPPMHVQVRFWKESALISMVRGAAIKDYSETAEWSVTPTRIGILIDNVRSALDALREVSSDYFNAIDAADMAARLPSHRGATYAGHFGGWQPLANKADSAHIASFDAVQGSPEWFDLASAGYALYDACFDVGTPLRLMLDELDPGSRVDFHWTKESGAGWVPHMPWPLMHMRMPDVTRATPVDPEAFLGLRYRLGSQAWKTQNSSRALSGASPTNSMNILFWGSKAGDDVAAEALWQSREFASWGQTQVPNAGQPDFKRQVIAAIHTPVPAPVGVVYLYCHCSVGAGDKVILRFGDSSKPQDVVTQTDLSFSKLADGPLIFANACTTASADPFKTGLLESHFFGRGVRAFIGTETKVPVQLASKFAWLYFQFFYRKFDPAPMAAGEAMAQARMFLWTQYRNVGGLFYSFVNQYDLYLASHEEVVALRQ